MSTQTTRSSKRKRQTGPNDDKLRRVTAMVSMTPTTSTSLLPLACSHHIAVTPSPQCPRPSSSSPAAGKSSSIEVVNRCVVFDDIESLVTTKLRDAGIDEGSTTITKDGWCLKEGLIHLLSVDSGHQFRKHFEKYGPPTYFHLFHNNKINCRHDSSSISMMNDSTTPCNADDDNKDSKKPIKTCFQSLCRTIAGQQLAGKAAQSIWDRLLDTVAKSSGDDLTPRSIINLVDKGSLEDSLRRPSGLSKTKAKSIYELATMFYHNELSEDVLSSPSTKEEEIRTALMKVHGIGSWSCDMFLMFFLEKANILPIGDLGVRKGLQKYFSSQLKNGKGKNGSLCQRYDKERIIQQVQPYKPYMSLFTYYMWKVADTKYLIE